MPKSTWTEYRNPGQSKYELFTNEINTSPDTKNHSGMSLGSTPPLKYATDRPVIYTGSLPIFLTKQFITSDPPASRTTRGEVQSPLCKNASARSGFGYKIKPRKDSRRIAPARWLSRGIVIALHLL
jgi:hypothetical protein